MIGTTISQATYLYQYRSYLETLLTYGLDTATSHLKNGLWYLESGELQARDPTGLSPLIALCSSMEDDQAEQGGATDRQATQ